MKTTIDLPDEILHRAKIVAAQRRTTLKELVIRGLELVTTSDESAHEARLRRLFNAMDAVEDFTAGNRLDREALHDR
jgi:hypothetical protein